MQEGVIRRCRANLLYSVLFSLTGFGAIFIDTRAAQKADRCRLIVAAVAFHFGALSPKKFEENTFTALPLNPF